MAPWPARLVLVLLFATCLAHVNTGSTPAMSVCTPCSKGVGTARHFWEDAAASDKRPFLLQHLRGGAWGIPGWGVGEATAHPGEQVVGAEPQQELSEEIEMDATGPGDVMDDKLHAMMQGFGQSDSLAKVGSEMVQELEAKQAELAAEEVADKLPSPSLPPPPSPSPEGAEADEEVGATLRVPSEYGLREALCHAGGSGEKALVLVDAGDYDEVGGQEGPLVVGRNRRVKIESTPLTDREMEQLAARIELKADDDDTVNPHEDIMGALVRGQVLLRPGSTGTISRTMHVLTDDNGLAACVRVEGGPWALDSVLVHAQPASETEQWGGIAVACVGASEVRALDSLFGGLSVDKLSADGVAVTGCASFEGVRCVVEYARFAAVRCLEEGLVKLVGSTVDYSGVGVSVGDQAQVEVEGMRFARLVWGGLGCAGDGGGTRLDVRQCHFEGSVWKGEERPGSLTVEGCTHGALSEHDEREIQDALESQMRGEEEEGGGVE